MNNPVFNALGGGSANNPISWMNDQIAQLKRQYSDPQVAIRMGNFTQQELDAAQAAAQQFTRQYLNK